MKILLIGEDRRIEEMKCKLKGLEFEIDRSDGDEDEDYQDYDVIFDLNFDDNPERIDLYTSLKNKHIFLSTVKISLAEAVFISETKVKCKLYGINALAGFIDKELWEVSVFQDYLKDDLEKVLNDMKVSFQLVQDRIGMVTPRILFMIINEACYTVQEGTASKEDIDLAMKFGTNYPAGPFEWADRIGISDVFESLISIYEDTKDERYKVCALLKRQYLLNRPFFKKKVLEST
ncbi:MAG: 3-hydroxyacyl-CoA dehydrogenase [Chitinophagales bacterium]|nr:3-hydroxyacyl-CoA dehydrogenase [Chitinophagales bacterium]